MLATASVPVETGVVRCGERPSKSTPRFGQTLSSKKFHESARMAEFRGFFGEIAKAPAESAFLAACSGPEKCGR
tara:strand:+ start:889 stop:1110 length:222 start_codon:yes stop_codon:yes gene_type:complete